MLQEQYEKHNLEMQPYLHYLAEYQKMKPEDIGRHLEIPYDEREGLFRLRFMGKNYTVSHPELEIHCLEEPDGQAVLCRDIHAKILVLRYFTEGDHMQATRPMNSSFWKGCGCASSCGRAMKNSRPLPRSCFRIIFPSPMPPRTRRISAMWCWII